MRVIKVSFLSLITLPGLFVLIDLIKIFLSTLHYSLQFSYLVIAIFTHSSAILRFATYTIIWVNSLELLLFLICTWLSHSILLPNLLRGSCWWLKVVLDWILHLLCIHTLVETHLLRSLISNLFLKLFNLCFQVLIL